MFLASLEKMGRAVHSGPIFLLATPGWNGEAATPFR